MCIPKMAQQHFPNDKFSFFPDYGHFGLGWGWGTVYGHSNTPEWNAVMAQRLQSLEVLQRGRSFDLRGARALVG